MSDLRIAEGVALDASYVTKVAAIVAQRRKGKTYCASVIAEELVAAGLPFLAVDPTGAWWGLRADAAGEGPGLPVVVLGGQHGDLPIDRHSGHVVADLAVDRPGWYVCDLSLFESHEAERTFVRALLERLYRRKGHPGMDFPLHVIVDEADLYAPEQPLPGDQQMLGAFKTLVKRGGLRGIGATVITQRPASLSKHVLEQADLLVALRVVGPNDRAAIDRWVKANADDATRAEMMGSLASLRLGEAWLYEPGAEPPLWERARIRERRTWNSSATPEPGQLRVDPTALALVDLDAAKEALAAIVERLEADNPDRLRAELADLRRENVDLRSDLGEALMKLAEGVGAATVPAELLGAASAAEAAAEAALEELPAARDDAVAAVQAGFLAVGEQLDRIRTSLRKARDDLGNMPVRPARDFPARDRLDPDRTAPRVRDEPEPVRDEPAALAEVAHYQEAGRDSSKRAPRRRPAGDGYDRSLIDTLAWFAGVGTLEVERPLLALFAGVSPRSSSYGKALARLQERGLVEYPNGGTVALTAEGLAAARPQSRIESNEDLHDELAARLPDAQGRIIRALTRGRSVTMSRPALAEATGQSPSSSAYGKHLAALKDMGFVDYPEPGIVAPVESRLWPLA